MEITTKAVETMGIINAQRQLILDEPLPVAYPTRVRVIILWPEESDINEVEWSRMAVINPAFDFLKEPEEDRYTLTDGRSFNG
ncbi:MAG: hypothetical protein ABH886_02810 [Candidatus Desantisbacteria bacterium]